MVDLSIIIPSWNTKMLLEQCLASIFMHPIACSYEVWVVDNASTDDSIKDIPYLFPEVKLIANSENLGYGRANNQAGKLAKGKYLLLLNSDTIVFPGAIDTLIQYLEAHPRVAAVGPRLLNADGSLQVSSFPAPTLGREIWRMFHLDQLFPLSRYPASYFAKAVPQATDTIMGACFLIRAEVVKRIGLFDEDYFMYSEEVDLCERIRNTGSELYWIPAAEVIHLGGMSTRQASYKMFIELYRNKVKFFRKHRPPFQTDLYRLTLLLASLVRIVICRLLIHFPIENRARYVSILENYKGLIKILPEL